MACAVWLMWVIRHVDALVWCWDGLKRALEGDGTQATKQSNVDELSSWLDVSIHITGCARSEKERQALDRLIASETTSAASAAGSWLVHGDRIQRSRIKSWRSKFLAIHSVVPSRETVKVCFCGPTPMASAITAAASAIKDFSVQVSSENFNEGKRPAVPQVDSTFKAVVVQSGVAASVRGRGLTALFDEYRATGAANASAAAVSQAKNGAAPGMTVNPVHGHGPSEDGDGDVISGSGMDNNDTRPNGAASVADLRRTARSVV